jgi:hypothetical protein
MRSSDAASFRANNSQVTKGLKVSHLTSKLSKCSKTFGVLGSLYSMSVAEALGSARAHSAQF